jgi:hypothetical protein
MIISLPVYYEDKLFSLTYFGHIENTTVTFVAPPERIPIQPSPQGDCTPGLTVVDMGSWPNTARPAYPPAPPTAPNGT